MTDIRMCDLSHWNEENIFMYALNTDNRIILKATQGNNYIDDTLYKRFLLALGCKDLKFIGVYHYLDRKIDADEQVAHFYKIYQRLSRIAIKCGIKLVPILDFEEGTDEQYHRFYTVWKSLCDTSLVTYVSYSWANRLNCFSNRLLWLAGWTNDTNKINDRLAQYPTCCIYQYTSKYIFTNISDKYTDRNMFLEDKFWKLFVYDDEVNA